MHLTRTFFPRRSLQTTSIIVAGATPGGEKHEKEQSQAQVLKAPSWVEFSGHISPNTGLKSPAAPVYSFNCGGSQTVTTPSLNCGRPSPRLTRLCLPQPLGSQVSAASRDLGPLSLAFSPPKSSNLSTTQLVARTLNLGRI